MSTGAMTVDSAIDAGFTRTMGKVVESLVVRGDLSALGPLERARFYVHACETLGLNPQSQPFAFLRLNGKEVMYANRSATDQLAAIHKLNREIVEGPKVIDLAGTKLVYAVCRATHPNGRIETATATLPLIDPVNVLMKVETKAKRRATLSILGLGMLDEMELETIPSNIKEPGAGIDLSVLEGATKNEEPASQGTPASEAAETVIDTPVVDAPPALAGFLARLGEIELPGESVGVWIKFRPELTPLSTNDREAAWKALCKRTEDVGKMKNAKVWLKKAIAEEDARRGTEPTTTQAPTEGEPLNPVTLEADLHRAIKTVSTADDGVSMWLEMRRDLTRLSQAASARLWDALAARVAVVGKMGSTKAAVTWLRQKLEEHDRPPPTGTDPAPATSTGHTTASEPRRDTAPSTSAPTNAQAMLAQFKEHLHGKARDPRNATREYSEIANSLLKRRALFDNAGIWRRALDVTRAELRTRGCEEPDALLTGVSQQVYGRAM